MLSLGFDRRRLHHGLLIAEGARWPRRLGWSYRAITFGHVILDVETLEEATLRHELVHVGQYERWGPLLLLAYPLAALSVWARGGHAYRDNPFERAARRLDQHTRSTPLAGREDAGSSPHGWE